MKRLKRYDLEAAVARVRQIPQPYRATLKGPTSVRKIFRKQEDAINFAKQFGQEMMVFSYESLSLGNEGQRLFLACGVQSFFHTYKQMVPSSRCHYEVIMVDRPAKLYLDLEFCRLSNENKDGEVAVDTFLKALCACIQFFYDITIKPSEIFILDASTSKKFSQHVIINNKNLVFHNNLEQGQLIRLLCKSLSQYSLLNTDFQYTNECSDCSNQINQLIQNIFPKIPLTNNDARNCFVLPNKFKQSISLSNELLWISVCDLGVYTRNRNFRLAGSCKLSGSGLLLPNYVNNKNQQFSCIWSNWQSWARYLVSYTDEQCSNFIHRPVKNCYCNKNDNNLLNYLPMTNNITNSDHVYKFVHENNANISLQSFPLTLIAFIKKIIQEWFNRGLPDGSINNNVLFSVENQIKVISFNEGKLIVKVEKLRFCERINRSHKSNHIILIFDLINGCYYQKCLDPDCRLVDFRSSSMPIPSDCLSITFAHHQDENVMQMHENNSTHKDEYFSAVTTPEDLMLSSILDNLQN
ncbi:unnamed protein product [Schistosoma turkestanicum]|nr:unnamed protein product [Schistosoma turkestanicum]